MRHNQFHGALITLALSFLLLQPVVAAPTDHFIIQVKAGPALIENVSGRLLVLLKKGASDASVDTDPFQPGETWVAAKEIESLQPNHSVWVDADDIAFPSGFSALPTGKYEMQVVLDVNHTYNYSQRSANDWVSNVVSFNWVRGGKIPQMTLSRHEEPDLKYRAGMLALDAKIKLDQIQELHFVSPLLSQFWGRPRQINAWVVLPPGYDASENRTYPTVYWTHGFSGNTERILKGVSVKIHERMEAGQIPAMIFVMLDQSIPQGTHEFADSVNNGPWGTALTTEFIPYLESRYRMDAKPTGRFLNGHSSGGWAALQLQINYPKIFGGTWSTSPDPSNFHDFTGTDLYSENANMYRRADGSDSPLIRDAGKVLATVKQFAQLEDVIGTYGGQLGSFEWVFSPRDDNGKPMRMFNRQTGTVDARVVAYWHDHYDLANIVTINWANCADQLRGRIHVIVGDADTFYLDGSAHKMQAVLDGLHAGAHFTYLPGRNHFDLYTVGTDQMGLMDQITQEMYAVARP